MPMTKIATASLEIGVGTEDASGAVTGDEMIGTGAGVQGAAPEAVVGIEDADGSVIFVPLNVLVTRHLHSTSSICAKRATLFNSNQLMQLLLL